MISKELDSLKLNNNHGTDFTSEEYKDFEEELLGFSVSNNPMILFSKYEQYFTDTTSIIDLKNDENCENYKIEEESLKVIGMIRKKNLVKTKNVDDMAFLDIEFLGEALSVVFFPNTWEKIDKRKIAKGKLVVIKLNVKDNNNKSFGNYSFIGENISILSFINNPEIIYFDLDNFNKVSSILTNYSNQCYNNNKEIKYITSLKRNDGKSKILPYTFWLEDKKEILKEIYYNGL